MSAVKAKQLPDYLTVDGFVLPGAFSPQAFREAVNFKPETGDLFVATYPKCGTTWTQQIMFLLRNDARPPKNHMEFGMDTPFLEFVGTEGSSFPLERRAFKIHLPFNLTPYSPNAKYICVVRNPKDCLVSFYHHTRSEFYNFADGDFNDYFELFLNGKVDYGDYFDHVLSWYERKDEANILIIIYEEMKINPAAAILKMATFMGDDYRKLAENEDKMKSIVEFSSFEYMKKKTNQDMQDGFSAMFNPEIDIDSLPISSGMRHVLKYQRNKENTSNKAGIEIVRKGIIGDWRNNFTEDQNKRMNEKIESKLSGTSFLDYWKSIDCL